MQLLTMYFCQPPVISSLLSTSTMIYLVNVSKSGLLLCLLVSNKILSEAINFDRAFCDHHRYPDAPNLNVSVTGQSPTAFFCEYGEER
jgi:hypothetical protein